MNFIGNHTQKAAQRITQSFGHAEQLVSAIASMFMHREDPLPCRQWPRYNQLLLALSDVEDARTLKEWQAADRDVQSGANALWLLAPCTMPVMFQNRFGEEVERCSIYAYRSEPAYRAEDTVGVSTWRPPASCKKRIKHLPIWDIAQTAHSHESFFRDQSLLVELIRSEGQRTHKPVRNGWLEEMVASIGAAVLLECMEEPREISLSEVSICFARHAHPANPLVFVMCLEVLDRVCESVEAVLNTAENFQSLEIPA